MKKGKFFKWIYFVLLVSVMVSIIGCGGTNADASGPGETSPDVVGTTDSVLPEDTSTSEETTTAPTDVDTPPTDETEAETTEPASTDPPETKPESTEPPASEPPTTEPPATEPPHSHSYSVANTVAPGCESQGYTVYSCSCGDSYNDNYTEATGHSYSSTVVDPTTSSQGYTQHTCSNCGDCYQDSFVDPLPAVTLDLAAAEAYGNQYAASTYGWIIDTSLNSDNAGFYPGGGGSFAYCIENGGQAWLNYCVKDHVEAMREALLSRGIERVYVNCDVIDYGDGTYWIRVYYG